MGPATLIPPGLDELGVEVYHDLDAALDGADVVNVLRIQLERQQPGLFPSLREYQRLFGITKERLQRVVYPDVLILHPGPANLGVEITPEVVEDRSVARGNRCRTGSLFAWPCCICFREVKAMRLLIKGGRIIDPAGKHAEGHDVDILCDAGSIVRIEPELNDVAADAVVDAAGAWVLPGFIICTHTWENLLRTPGAARYVGPSGGARGLCQGCRDAGHRSASGYSRSAARSLQSRSSGLVCDILPAGALTHGRSGQEPTEWASSLKRERSP